MSRSFALSLVLLLAACAAARPLDGPPRPSTPPLEPPPPRPEPVPRLQLPAGVVPVHAALELHLDPGLDGSTGTVDYLLDVSVERAALWLNGQGLTVTEAFVEVAGARIPASYQEVDPVGVARVTPARPVGPGRIRLHLAWRASWSAGLQGLFRTEVDGARYLVTQFEPVAARRAFPAFDEPRFKHPWDVTLVVPARLVAVGNTLPVSDTPTGDGRRRLVLATTRPLPSYLLAWAVGPWDVVEATAPANEVRRTPLPVRGFAPAGRGAELAFALRDGNALLAVLERWFGSPHPYDKLDHLAAPDFSGAMENAGLITYASQALLLREAEASHRARTWTWSYLAHEMAHQWFGDLVTMPWWDDTWLNESFASWMEDEAVAIWRPESRARLARIGATDQVMELDSLAATRAVRQPLVQLEAVHDQFDDLSYAKGSAVISMFERWMGSERFRAGIRAYLAAHADGSGDAEQLFAALSAAAGREVGPAFHSFLDQPGVPLVTTRTRCEGGRAWLELAQRRWLPIGSRAQAAARWRIPLCARWGVGAEVREGCTMLEAPTGSLSLGPGCPDWVAPNAGGAGYYRTAQSPSELTALLVRGWPQLTVEERLVTAQSAVAALRSGALPVAEALPLFARLARDPDGEVASTPMAEARRLVERVAPPEVEAAARRWARALYAPALDRLGLVPRDGEPAADTALRVDAAYFMAEVGLDRPRRDRLARSGLAWLDPGGPSLRREAVPADLAGLAVGLAVEEGGTPAFELAARRLATEQDGITRLRLLRALSRAREPSLVARAQALTGAPGTALAELLLVPRLQIDNLALEQAGWDGYRRQADEAAARLPDAAGSQPSAAARFCDAGRLVEVRAFFEPRALERPAMVRPLAESLESIELCLAAVEAQREQATRAFQAWAGRSSP